MAVAAPGPPASAAGEGAGPRFWLSWRDFAFLLVELALLTVAIRQFRLESSAFLRVWLLACGGYAVHSWLPYRWRLPFFLGLSLASIGVVFGAVDALWIVAVGIGLIGLAHVPVRFGLRVALLVAAASVLVALRVDWLPSPWSLGIWPILGSMFMFRMIVYLYDLRHEGGRMPDWRALSYFFLLPNVCFPLFPVVDWKTFRRVYYDTDAAAIYQRGVSWMLRGVVHLVLYRVVYYYGTLTPAEVQDPIDLARFLVSNVLLYLRISGQFHLIVGMLHLFGFHLPETHHNYLLTSSFTDFWRRINIYWKDFMQKVFYYPAFFALRRWGGTWALVLSTGFVFMATWFLHAYQWFWIQGRFLLAWQDVSFWAILAVLVVANSLYEARHGRRRSLRGTDWTWAGLGGRASRVAATLVCICVLWSLWTTESLAAWVSLWSSLGGLGRMEALWTGAVLVGAAGVLDGLQRVAGPAPGGASRPGRRGARVSERALTFGLLVAVAALGIPAVYQQLGARAANVVHSLRTSQLSRIDEALLQRGYYEDLLRVDRFNSQLWEVYMKKPLHWLDVTGSGLDHFTGDFLVKELRPSTVVVTSFGPMSTNRWGMRDREYERSPAAGTYRIAVLGASSVMGWGVGDAETFEARLEARLNAERNGRGPERYEALNFAVPGYLPTQQLRVFDRAVEFAPDAVLYVVAGRELTAATYHLVEVVRKGVAVPYGFLREILVSAGVDGGTPEGVALQRLEPYRAEVLSGVYAHIVDGARRHGAVPVMVLLPWVREGNWSDERPEVRRLAEEAGFLVFDLSDVYRDRPVSSLRLAEWDDHPNALAHGLIADRLFDVLVRNEKALFTLGEAGTGAWQPETEDPWRASRRP